MAKETTNVSEAKQQGTNKSGRTPLRGSSIDELSARLGEIEGVNEDLATFLAHNWQRFLGALCVVLLAVVLYYQYRGTQAARMGEASSRFEDVTKQLSRVTEPAADVKPEEKEKDIATLFEQVRALESAQRGNIYGQLAGLYAAEGYRAKGEFDKAEGELAKYDWKQFSDINTAKKSSEVTKNSLTAELAAFLFVRIQLVKGEQNLTQARKVLKSIVLGGRFLNLEALIVLFRLSESPEQTAASVETARALLAARPELRESVDTQLGGLGINLDDGV